VGAGRYSGQTYGVDLRIINCTKSTIQQNKHWIKELYQYLHFIAAMPEEDETTTNSH
jgi:hypothetical protein